MSSSSSSRGERRRRAVMSDVARLSGVSLQTVSRVINGGAVAADTRERVLDSIRVLDYRPNSVARALVTGRTRTIGVISFDTRFYGPASTLLAIEQAAHARDYFIIIVSPASDDAPTVQDAVKRLRGQGVEGILVVSAHAQAMSTVLRFADDLPLVVVGSRHHHFSAVEIDQEAGAVLATRHLLDAGHETVFHLAGPADWREANERIGGWRSTVVAAGATLYEPPRGDWTARSGYELADQILSRRDITAVFAANDQMALGLLRAANEAGRSVPEDLSIVGFDDIDEALYLTPPLTTVRQPFADLGRESLSLLLREIAEGCDIDQPTPLIPELVIRSSTSLAGHVQAPSDSMAPA